MQHNPPAYCVTAAEAEGWAIFDCGFYPEPRQNEWPPEAEGKPRHEIQRLDDEAIFASDVDAIRHVFAQARAGSAMHADALHQLEQLDPYSYAWALSRDGEG